MDRGYRDDFTNSIESYYGRKVFFGDITLDEVPEEYKDIVIKELKSVGLGYMVDDEEEE